MVATTRATKRSAKPTDDNTTKQENKQRGRGASRDAPGAIVCGNKLVNTHGIMPVRVETVKEQGSDVHRRDSSAELGHDEVDTARTMHAAGNLYNYCIVNHHYYYADDSGVYVEGPPPKRVRKETE